MPFAELEPLVVKVAPLQGNPDASDVWEQVTHLVGSANTPTMAQSACESVLVLCHPKAWGNRDVRGFDNPRSDWNKFLEDLACIAIVCTQRIYERYSRRAGVGG